VAREEGLVTTLALQNNLKVVGRARDWGRKLAGLRSAVGFQQEVEAVAVGDALALPWSSGQAEDHFPKLDSGENSALSAAHEGTSKAPDKKRKR
jgi:hypothetical protein